MASKQVEPPVSGGSGGLVWISVEHELPDSDISVLIWGPSMSDPFIGYYDDGDFYTVHGRFMKVTHWMDLPEPPGTWAEQSTHLAMSVRQLVELSQLAAANPLPVLLHVAKFEGPERCEHDGQCWKEYHGPYYRESERIIGVYLPADNAEEWKQARRRYDLIKDQLWPGMDFKSWLTQL